MELHRCRFVDYTPAAINAVAFSPNTYINAFLACGRSNGEIEIWNPTRRWTLLKTIPGSENEALESLIWTHQVEPVDMQPDDPDYQSEKKRLIKTEPRLFSGGLNATVTEWDLKKLKPKQSVASNGGTVWCMVTNPSHTKLAIGCEDGCIRILNVADDQLYYERSFTPTRGKL
jgi:U3 small nucleolar RNA-associated protein 4